MLKAGHVRSHLPVALVSLATFPARDRVCQSSQATAQAAAPAGGFEGSAAGLPFFLQVLSLAAAAACSPSSRGCRVLPSGRWQS